VGREAEGSLRDSEVEERAWEGWDASHMHIMYYLPVTYIGCILSTGQVYRMYSIYQSCAEMRVHTVMYSMFFFLE